METECLIEGVFKKYITDYQSMSKTNIIEIKSCKTIKNNDKRKVQFTNKHNCDNCDICMGNHDTHEHPKCSLCGKLDHFLSECPFKCNYCFGNHYTSDHKCNHCGDKTHISVLCPNTIFLDFNY